MSVPNLRDKITARNHAESLRQDPFFETGCQAALTRVHASPRQGICIVLCSIKHEALTLTPSFILIAIDFASVEGCRRVERELCAICSAEAAAITDPLRVALPIIASE